MPTAFEGLELGPWSRPPDPDQDEWTQSDTEFEPGPFWHGFEDT